MEGFCVLGRVQLPTFVRHSVAPVWHRSEIRFRLPGVTSLLNLFVLCGPREVLHKLAVFNGKVNE